MFRRPVIGWVFLWLATATPAFAAITAFWVPVASGDGSVGATYPAPAVTAPAGDPLLLGMQTWDLRVTTDGNWANAGLRATLPDGSLFYRRNSNGTSDNGLFKPDSSGFPNNPNREFWSYLTAPVDDPEPFNIIISGGFPPGTNPPSNGNATSPVPGTFSASWNDLIFDPPSPPGGWQITRLTFPLGVRPDILTIDQNPDFSRTSQTNPDSTTAIPEIPEPRSLGLLVSAGLLALRRHNSDHAK